MSATTMAQVNIRMDARTKQAGDATLERADVTPTQFVRAIWAKLALGAEALDQLVEVLARDPSPHSMASAEQLPGDWLLEQVVLRQSEFERELGLSAATYEPMSDEEYEDYLLEEKNERERERMVWHAE